MNTPVMGIDTITEYGFERTTEHSEQLAIGRWGKLWYVLDRVASREVGKPSHVRTPVPTRWEAVEQADTLLRDGQYR